MTKSYPMESLKLFIYLTIASSLFMAIPTSLEAQPSNDDCVNAISINQTGYCNTTAGSTINATESIPAIYCLGTAGSADDDVWYKFTATTAAPTIAVIPQAGFDVVVDLRTGLCDGMNINCADYKGPGGTETIYTGSMTVGQTYLVRIYGFGSGPASQGNFSICVYGAPPIPPVNDNCSGALFLQGNDIGTTVSTTQSTGPVDCEGLIGDADDDVWYQFQGGFENITIRVEGLGTFDPVVDFRNSGCLGTTLACADLTANSGVEIIKAIGLPYGDLYHIRVYSYGSGASAWGEFTLTVSQSVCSTCPFFDFELNPTTEWKTHSSSLFSSSCNIYQVLVTEGNEYSFKTGCGNGATADFDTQLQLLDENCNTIATVNDGCEEGRTNLTWEATYTGYVYLKITGNGANSFGHYTLSYKTPYPVATDDCKSGKEELVVFPNPTQHEIHLKWHSKSSIQSVHLLTFIGKELFSEEIKNNPGNNATFRIDVDPGIYLLRVETDQGVRFKKVEVTK